MFEIVSDAAGSEVKFDEHGDGLARYEILNFRKSEHNGTNGYQYQASESTFFVIRNFFFFFTFFLPSQSSKNSRKSSRSFEYREESFYYYRVRTRKEEREL